jgi:hypothetical protein
MTASNGERDDNAVSDFEIIDLLAGFNNLPHEFVAKNISGLECRYVSIVEVKIRSADSGECDLHNCIARIEDLRIVNFFDANVLLLRCGELLVWDTGCAGPAFLLLDALAKNGPLDFAFCAA